MGKCNPAAIRCSRTIALAISCHSMAKSSQQHLSVRASSIGVSTAYSWKPRPSPWAQLLWATGGAISIGTDDGPWSVALDRALWLPAEHRHRVQASGRVALHALYFSARSAVQMPARVTLLHRSQLFVALCAEVLERGGLDARRTRDRLVLALLSDGIRDRAAVVPRGALEPMWPTDPRAVSAASRLVATVTEDIHASARVSGASERTLARLFRRETGYGIAEWRRRATMARAASALLHGRSVTSVAIASGYDSVSAFTFAFKQIVGTTPGRYRVRANV